MTRASVLEVLNEDYVRTAEAKGLTQRVDHPPARAAQRDAAGGHHDRPADRRAAGRRGAHRDGVRLQRHRRVPRSTAIGQRDFAVLQGFILFIAVIYVVVNLIVDLSYGVIDPEGEGAMTTHDGKTRAQLDRLAELGRVAPTTSVGTACGRGRSAGCAATRRRSSARVIVPLFVLVAVFAPLLAPYEPDATRVGSTQVDARASCPARPRSTGSASTTFGSDVFTRLIYGARQTLIIGVVSTCRPHRRCLLGGLAGARSASAAGGGGGSTPS